MAAYEVEQVAGVGALMRPGVEATQSPDEMAACVREALVTNGAVDALARAVAELEQRLYQVLMPTGPEPDGAMDPVGITSPLHGALREINQRVGLVENRLHDIMGRLTV